ncbi:P-loop containing nucleoside triphosphate hydrolase protein [Boletus reticuloceps]|uniref:DNA 3'-5' helicase n=1 Tax=Boletus reticuloceps TaxID=495285 RepID=A0A8I2YMJ5_9AGAM|nr:P-loop containing nucleoside triphosphate hydrolase protein [Boletus reticuloceps]
MLRNPETPKFTHIFVDEHHDQLDSPRDQQKGWKTLAEWASTMDMSIILLSGMVPPCLERPLMKPYRLLHTDTAFIRLSMNRPEIGLHTIYLDPSASRAALAHLVYTLHSRLKVDERMLVLFPSCVEAEAFAVKASCTVFHSRLPSSGNMKVYNLDLWDWGEIKLMACTSAFATGVDRPNIRFIVNYNPTYSLTMVAQMAGHAGWDRSESHVFFTSSCNAHIKGGLQPGLRAR